MSHRLFVGLRPPADARGALLGLMGGVPDARWQTDAQLHLTLLFLGTVERPVAEDIAVALGRVRGPALALCFGAFGAFDTRHGRISALWVGVEPRERLAALAERVRAAAASAGVAVSARRFVPHVTLARFPARGAERASLARFLADRRPPALRFAVDAFHLFESHMGSGGSHYRVVASWPLETLR
jgi:2'-5' RNA ligase